MRADLSGLVAFQAKAPEKPNYTKEGVLDYRMKRLVEIANPFITPESHLCDVGCEDGKVTVKLNSNHLYGISEEGAALDWAKKRGVNAIACELEDGSQYPYENEQFDIITCFDVLEHCLRTDFVLNEINRILKMNGLFICSVPNTATLAALLYFFLDLPAPFSAKYKCNHYRDFTSRMLRGIVKIHGFEVLHTEGTFINPFLGGFSRWVARKIPRFAGDITVVCRKTSVRSITDCYIISSSELLDYFKTGT